MSVQKITFKNYKSFEQEQVFEIKPITIVIGRNNSGKTALIQLPLMLHAWMEDRNGMLSTSFNGIEFAKQMKELVFNSDKDRCLEISFTPQSEIECSFRLQYIDDTFKIVFLEWKYKNNTVWKAEKKGNKYKITINETTVEYVNSLEKELSGILPNSKIVLWEDEEVDFDENGDKIPYTTNSHTLRGESNVAVQYFTGIRHVFPDANLSFNDLKYKTFDIKGEFAAHYLYKNSDILEDVKTWYIENMDGWGIGLEKNLHNEGFYLYLEDFTKENGVKIPITQTGQGITQVLPLVTTAFKSQETWKQIWSDDSFQMSDIIIEQPELHIHPAAHGSLVELFAASTLFCDNNYNYILETHSEVMLLRIRRLVAEGKLKPEQVAIYWVDTEEGEAGKRSFLKKIEVDEEGMLSEWPEGVFSEDHEEVLAIRRAQRRREDARE
jgi:AAA15 family ATPase/GTPase